MARLVGFPFFFTMDGPKLRHKKSTLKMKSDVVLVWPVWPDAGPVLAQTDPSIIAAVYGCWFLWLCWVDDFCSEQDGLNFVSCSCSVHVDVPDLAA